MSTANVYSRPHILNSVKTRPIIMSSPWGKVAVAQCSLEEVMSEQLASEIGNIRDDDVKVDEEDGLLQALTASVLHTEAEGLSATAESTQGTQLSDAELAAELTSLDSGGDPSDELIARYLQKQFDEEYDAMLEQKEKQFNGTSKVSVSFDNYKMKHQRNDSGQELIDEDSCDEDSCDEEYPEFPAQTNWETGKPVLGSQGYTGQGKNIVTKHDKISCGRRNAERLMEMPPGIEIGDGEGMDMQLPDKVFNKLRRHTVAENKKGHKLHEKKDHSTAIKAVDEKTRILLFKLISSGYLTSVLGVVSEGKEAVVLKATGGMRPSDEKPLPEYMILKVMKTTMNEFRTRAKYVYGDPILSKDKYKKQNPRKIMKLWAEKEFLNLNRMRRNGLPCPTPLTLKKHILVMTSIGGEHPAPKLKDTRLSTADYQDAYEQTVNIMKQMYHKCGLVHADLSSYNLLWHSGTVWVIDVSQAVSRDNDNAHDFLLRDCQNICHYFRQVGVHGVSTEEELFMDITNYSMDGEGKVFVAQVQRYAKEDYSFEYFFQQSEEKRLMVMPLSEDNDSSDDDTDYHVGEDVNEGRLLTEAEESRVSETPTAGNDTQRNSSWERYRSSQKQEMEESAVEDRVKGHKDDKTSAGQGSAQDNAPSDKWIINCTDCS